MLCDQLKDQLAFAAGVTGVDQRVDILSLDQPGEQLQTVGTLVDRLEIEVRRNDRQIGERPFASLDVELLRCGDLDQMADRRRQQVVIAFEIIALFGEPAERSRDIRCDRRLLGNDQGFSHVVGRQVGAQGG